jgi:hypothetical protein
MSVRLFLFCGDAFSKDGMLLHCIMGRRVNIRRVEIWSRILRTMLLSTLLDNNFTTHHHWLVSSFTLSALSIDLRSLAAS